MGVAVEAAVDSDRPKKTHSGSKVSLRMLGPFAISRAGGELTLPPSRKVRALVGYLALAPHAVTRAQLCELLWDVPNDPKGELRWCLSKIRSVLDDSRCRRVVTHGDTVKLDLADCFVDAIKVARAAQEGIAGLRPARLENLARLFGGDFLDGLEIDRSPLFDSWLISQRRRFRGCRIALLEHLVRNVPAESNEVFGYLETWLDLAAFDLRAHAILVNALARRGRISEGDAHFAATARAFEAEGLDCSALRDAWQAAKKRQTGNTQTVTVASAGAPIALKSDCDDSVAVAPRRASVAVMPFIGRTDGRCSWHRLAEGLAHDVITRLAKLRSLFVIAQGTVFALHERGVAPEEAGRTLNVDYIVGGFLRHRGNRVTVTVELSETRTARIVWREVFDRKLDDAFLVLDEIGDGIVASIAGEIEANERKRAILKPPNSLDAWEAYHRGLWHIYQFNRSDNEQAQHFFEIAVRLDPTFARAYAGLSFTHFTNAFQRWREREREIARAFEAAGRSLMIDDHDPAAHWAMGRALWLRGHLDQSLVALERAVDLSPSFAHGHYALAFVHCQSGDPRAAVKSSDHARHLSPFDPLLFSMMAARATALVRLGQFEEAADWAVKAATRPNAHVHILGIAAYCLALADRRDEACAVMASIQKVLPSYHVDNLVATFRPCPDAEALFRRGASRIANG